MYINTHPPHPHTGQRVGLEQDGYIPQRRLLVPGPSECSVLNRSLTPLQLPSAVQARKYIFKKKPETLLNSQIEPESSIVAFIQHSRLVNTTHRILRAGQK